MLTDNQTGPKMVSWWNPEKKVLTDKQSDQNCPRGCPREQDFTHPNLAITQTSFFITNNLEINKVLHILHKHRNNDCHTSQALEIRNNDRLTSGELEGTEIMIATRSGTWGHRNNDRHRARNRQHTPKNTTGHRNSSTSGPTRTQLRIETTTASYDFSFQVSTGKRIETM